MSVIYCHGCDTRWDSDFIEACPRCPADHGPSDVQGSVANTSQGNLPPDEQNLPPLEASRDAESSGALSEAERLSRGWSECFRIALHWQERAKALEAALTTIASLNYPHVKGDPSDLLDMAIRSAESALQARTTGGAA